MKLYHSPRSPFVRKVMVTLHLTGQIDEVELIPGSGTPLEPNEETVSANPLGKIPCLVTEEGESLFDSRVICRYLDWRAQAGGGGGLYPDGAALFPVLTAEALADGIMEAVLMTSYEQRQRPEELRYQPWVEAQAAKAARGTEALERLALIHSGPVNAASVAAACALGYVDFRLPDLGWRARCPTLAAWYEEFARNQPMQETVPPA